MSKQVGICSLCGGRVIGPDNRYTTQPSYTIQCENCYATKELLPTIDMGKAREPARQYKGNCLIEPEKKR